MKLILNFIIILLNLIFAVMKLLPVQNKVVFISRQDDCKSDDMKLLEKAISQCQNKPVKQVFLCKKFDGGVCKKALYCFHALRQMYHLATSKVVVLDSYCIAVSVLRQRHSTVIIQMWHALGALKKFGFSIIDEEEGRSSKIADIMKMHRNYSYILASSEPCVPFFADAFDYKEESIKIMSLPRVDKLTDKALKKSTIEQIYERYPEFHEKKLVVYAPTFRKGKDISKEIDDLASQFDKDKYVFILKRHPLMKKEEVMCLEDRDFPTIDMLIAADYVICDYSAVVFEAAILKKPLFFYDFDYDRYSSGRDFYINYLEEMPGVIFSDAKQIASAVKEDNYDLKKVEAFSRKYVEEQDECSRKLADFILSFIN